MTDITFEPWPKIARLNRDIVITEKIDGTNAAVVITRPENHVLMPRETLLGTDEAKAHWYLANTPAFAMTYLEGDLAAYGAGWYVAGAQSRKRLIAPGDDNFGFASWVDTHIDVLAGLLGPGRHFGEWWGRGIQRGYGLETKAFSLFNVSRYAEIEEEGPIRMNDDGTFLATVPLLYAGPFSQERITEEVQELEVHGSVAAQGFPTPEGVIVFHTASQTPYKVTIKDDESPKGSVASFDPREELRRG